MKTKILIIDDEKQIRLFLRVSLKAQGYDVLEAETGQKGIESVVMNQPDLMVLDLGLNDLDGKEVISQIRQFSNIPIIVLSVRDSEQEKVNCLDLGAQDYMTKPFGVQEFLARVRNLLRLHPGKESLGDSELTVGSIRLDILSHQVYLKDQRLKLTRKEYLVLKTLMEHPGQVVTKTYLLRRHWGDSHTEDTHYLRVVIGRLRQKIQTKGNHVIETEPSVGYRIIDSYS
ncbi:response regulator transcription factor [Hydrogenovibrio sp. 3SP14C1]|uniref:response regulator n=1 Tax=Hydrogenovibrio sp. 3SP14C1 TaxID=3038774 RepID=UPI0024161BBF|nr:response regulator transcription factor [Hydrogenovibrio sp. 3SP14C1]MDG4813263.1 response regulator transcription factor [Hydrogenovibrio sp. 3SP14C1]